MKEIASPNQPASLGQYKIDWFLLALIGLLLQAFWLTRLAHPTYMDAYYYTTNGQRLAQGAGFTEEIIWQFLDEPEGIPHPSHTYWMPLPSIMASFGYRLNATFGAAQSPFWLLGGLLPLFAYLLSRVFIGPRWQGWVAALFTASGGYYAAFLSQPTTFAPFAWAGGGCLLALAALSRSPRRGYWLLAGLLAGLAHLTRADGILFLGLAGLWWLFQIKQGQLIRQPQQALLPLALVIGGYLLVMGGWLGRNLVVTGQLLPTTSSQTLFLTTYDDLFAYGRQFTPATYLEWGLGPIIRSKLEALLLAGQTFVAVVGLIFLTPFIVVGWWGAYRSSADREWLRPLTWYTLLLFSTMSLLFTFPGTRGSLFHSSIAIWPWAMVLATDGLSRSVDWVGQRLPHWQPARAKKIFAGLFIGVAFLLTLAISGPRLTPTEDPAIYRQVGQRLPPTAVVLVGNAPAFYYHTGLPALTIPNEPLTAVTAAAERYGATHLLLNENHPQPLVDFYEGQTTHPRWEQVEQIGNSQLYRLMDDE